MYCDKFNSNSTSNHEDACSSTLAIAASKNTAATPQQQRNLVTNPPPGVAWRYCPDLLKSHQIITGRNMPLWPGIRPYSSVPCGSKEPIVVLHIFFAGSTKVGGVQRTQKVLLLRLKSSAISFKALEGKSPTTTLRDLARA